MIRRTSPFGELLSLRQAMDRLMEHSFVLPKPGLMADEAKPRQIPITGQSIDAGHTRDVTNDLTNDARRDAGRPAEARSTDRQS